MQTRKLSLMVSSLAVLGLLMASCAPAVAPTPTAKPPAAPAAPSPTPKPAAEQPRYGGTLNICLYGDPVHYDPLQATTAVSNVVVPCYSGIVQHDPLEHTKVIGDLAEKWDMTPDGVSYTFHLYKNAKWHDGPPFTSEDARFSLELVRKPPRGVVSPRQEWLKAVDKIEAPDKDTLKITLQYPSASFLHNLADGRIVIVPQHVFEAKGSMKRDVVGTGPYKFKSFTPGSLFSVVKNPDYFIKGRPYVDGITWYIISDYATRFAALRTHRVQVTSWQGLTPSQSATIRKEMSDKILIDRSPGLVFVGFWMPHTKAPWNDIRVRRAVELTIDRPKVVKVACEGVADVSGYMPPGVWSLPENELSKMAGYREPKDAEIAEAKRLMAEAGYAQGIKTTTNVRRVWTQHERAAVAVKEQLTQIGIEATPSLMEDSAFSDHLYKRTFETAVQTGSGSFDDPDQIFGAAFVTGQPRNFSGFSDEKIDKWYDEQARAIDPAKRKEIVLDMQRRLHELIPLSVLYWQVFETGYWKEVKNFRAGIGAYNNLKFQDVWLVQ